MGVLTVGLATGSAQGMAGAAYHMMSHALFKSLLFLCAGALVHSLGVGNLSEMGGLFRRVPGIAVAFTLGSFAIAGLPPLNGYAGIGLVHDALLAEHQYVPLSMMLFAQVLTVAALGKATWQAFYRRPRGQKYERDEKLRPGMFISLSVLGGGCVLFGVLPSVLLRDLAAPTAAGLLAPAAYAQDILAAGGPLPSLRVSFHYFDGREISTVIGIVLGALPVGLLVLSDKARPIVSRIRSVQTGSVNDYAAYLVVGLVGTVVALVAG
jgi:multicomponent Na+:H+ antiporter subunit D